jgi:hypothetical protein
MVTQHSPLAHLSRSLPSLHLPGTADLHATSPSSDRWYWRRARLLRQGAFCLLKGTHHRLPWGATHACRSSMLYLPSLFPPTPPAGGEVSVANRRVSVGARCTFAAVMDSSSIRNRAITEASNSPKALCDTVTQTFPLRVFRSRGR